MPSGASLALRNELMPGSAFAEAALPAEDRLRVEVDWLRELIDHAAGRCPPPAGWRGGDFLVLGGSWAGNGGGMPARRRHIPGAAHIDTDELETPAPAWRLRDIPSLQRTLGAYGIAADTTVIVYGDCQIAAARVWWILRHAGVRDVRLLDGGLQAWIRAGLPVQPIASQRAGLPFATAPRSRCMLASTPDVREALHSGTALIVDVRSPAEFDGTDSGYDYIEAAGRIPGAIHAGDADDAAGLYVAPDGHLRSPSHILQVWRAAGLDPLPSSGRFARDVVFYCGGGWRSSLACFYAAWLGLANVRNYSDGWGGWSTTQEAAHNGITAVSGRRQRLHHGASAPCWRIDQSARSAPSVSASSTIDITQPATSTQNPPSQP